MSIEHPLRYVVIGCITVIFGLTIFIGYLLLKMSHGQFKCEIAGSFNQQGTIIEETISGTPQDDDGVSEEPKKHVTKKIQENSTTGVTVSGPPPAPTVSAPANTQK